MTNNLLFMVMHGPSNLSPRYSRSHTHNGFFGTSLSTIKHTDTSAIKRQTRFFN